MIKRVLEIISKIPEEKRKRLAGLTFIVEKDAFQVHESGKFINGQYFRDNSVVIYEVLVESDDALKHILSHELAHHFGMDEREVRRYFDEN